MRLSRNRLGWLLGEPVMDATPLFATARFMMGAGISAIAPIDLARIVGTMPIRVVVAGTQEVTQAVKGTQRITEAVKGDMEIP